MPWRSQRLAHPGEVPVRGHQHAVRAHHGLQDHRGDGSGALEGDHRLEVLEGPGALLGLVGRAEGRPVQVGAEEVHRPGHRGLVGPAPRLPGGRDRRGRGPVVAPVGGEHLGAAGVGLGHADGVLHRLGPTVGEEHLVQARRCVPRDQGRGVAAGVVGEGRADGAQPLRLGADGIHHTGVLVAEVEVHQLGREVEVLVALLVPEHRAPAAGHGQGRDEVLRGPRVEHVGPVGSGGFGVASHVARSPASAVPSPGRRGGRGTQDPMVWVPWTTTGATRRAGDRRTAERGLPAGPAC